MNVGPVNAVASAFTVLCLLASGAAGAATYHAGDPAQLIDAIERANDRPGRDTVRLSVGTGYSFDTEHVSGMALPPITDDLFIDGRNSVITWSGERGAGTGMFLVEEFASVEIAELRLTHVQGGAITVRGDMTLRGSTLADNTNRNEGAGALTVAEDATVRVIRTLFDHNFGNKPSYGGAIHNSGELTVVSSTFRDNQTWARCGTFGGIPCRPPESGPYFDAVYNLGRARLVNSTFKDNAIVNFGTLDLVHATATGSFLRNADSGTFRVVNSAVLAATCAGVESLGHNVAGIPVCKLGHPTDRVINLTRTGVREQLTGRDGQLVAEIEEDSPLVDAADPARCPPTDALARERPVDGNHDGLARCDIGAVELHPGSYPVDGRVTGLWYEPERDGHYLLVERLASGRLTVFWATYDGNGERIWLFGSGEPERNVLHAPLTLQRGMRFGEFDRDDLLARQWGQVSVAFADCANLTMTWSVEGDASLDGLVDMTRLTQASGQECLP